ncbi:MAG: hypothetical protein RLY85_1852 [Bacteroidota bacterium]
MAGMKWWVGTVIAWCMTMVMDSARAQKRWDGEAGDSLWHNPVNWHPNGVPGPIDDVLIDNSIVAAPVWINLGTDTAHVNSIRIQSSGWQHTLQIPATNVRMPVLRLDAAGIGLDIGPNTRLLNSSSAPAGNPIELIGKMAIRNGGEYIHHTARGNAYLVGKLMTDSTTAKGQFTFDVPGTAGYTVSLTGRHFGSLLFTASTGRKSYSGSGSNDLHVHGNLIVGDSAALTSTITARIMLKGNLQIDGRLSLNPVTGDSTGRLIELSSDSGSICIKGILETGMHFRGFEQSVGKVKMLSGLQLPAGTYFQVKTGGILDMDTCSIGGNGRFRSDSGSQLILAHEQAISNGTSAANIMTIVQQIHERTGVVLTGSRQQSAGNGFPGTLGSLVLNKDSGKFRVDEPMLLTDSLVLARGIIQTSDSALLTINGSVKGGHASSFINGPCKIEASNRTLIYVPVGDSITFAPLTFKTPKPTSFSISLKFNANRLPDGENALKYPLKKISNSGYWQVDLTNPTDSVMLHAPIFSEATSGFTALPFLATRATDSTHWQLAHTHIARDSNSLSTPYMRMTSSIWTFTELLPVALSQNGIRLRALHAGSMATLYWDVDNPEHFKAFVIESSNDGQNFKILDSLHATPGKHNQQYVIRQPSLMTGRTFFRVSGVQESGSEYSSNIVHLDLGKILKLFPNPVTNLFFINCPLSAINEIGIHDAKGQVMAVEMLDYGPVTGFKISHLAAGLYLLKLVIGKKQQTFYFLKR